MSYLLSRLFIIYRCFLPSANTLKTQRLALVGTCKVPTRFASHHFFCPTVFGSRNSRTHFSILLLFTLIASCSALRGTWQRGCSAPPWPRSLCSCAVWAVLCPTRIPGRERPSYSWRPPCRRVGRWCWLTPSSGWTPSCLKWSRRSWWKRTSLPPCISSRPSPSSGPAPSSVCSRRCPKVSLV